MRSSKEKLISGKDGITLIALVITIIVLLILAGISISMLTGDNGLLTKATQAKNLTEKSNLEEQLKLAITVAKMDENNFGKINEEILKEELKKYGIEDDMIIKSPANAEGSTFPWYITKEDVTCEISSVGQVAKVEAPPHIEEAPKAKVGDYVNYKPDVITSEKLNELNSMVNSNSGYESAQSLGQESNLEWRVLETDSDGNILKIISTSPTSKTLGLKGAKGYNNAVYLLNKACEMLYSKSGIAKARNINIKDLSERYNDATKNTVNKFTTTDTYGENNVSLGDTKRYYAMMSTYYPKIAEQENGMGINTSLDSKGKNTLKENGIDESQQIALLSEGGTEAGTNGITVTQTDYNIDNPTYIQDIYYELFHGYGSYWLSSRGVGINSMDCDFKVRKVKNNGIDEGSKLFNSLDMGNEWQDVSYLRPVVSIENSDSIKFVEQYDETYNIWDI